MTWREARRVAMLLKNASYAAVETTAVEDNSFRLRAALAYVRVTYIGNSGALCVAPDPHPGETNTEYLKRVQ